MAKKEKQTRSQGCIFPCIVQASSSEELTTKLEKLRQEMPEGTTLVTGAVGQSPDRTTYFIYADIVKL